MALIVITKIEFSTIFPYNRNQKCLNYAKV